MSFFRCYPKVEPSITELSCLLTGKVQLRWNGDVEARQDVSDVMTLMLNRLSVKRCARYK